jgi:4-amino-4-deoxychorismate lyase
MYQLVESIKIKEGVPFNLEFHNERYSRTLMELFGIDSKINLGEVIDVPSYASCGIVKCRIEYDTVIKKVEYIPYIRQTISSIIPVQDNEIDYKYKYLDRSSLTGLKKVCGPNEDILIIKNGYVTDSSSANVIFRKETGDWVTPKTFLLRGTKRESLIRKGIITEKEIKAVDIREYTEIRFINAMIDIEDTKGIPVERIRLDLLNTRQA